MALKVFLSHQRRDTYEATRIGTRIMANGLQVYLDVADETSALGVDDLTAHIQRQMESCTQLMAVVSANARESWWVPWEIGVASEKSYPIASFALDQILLPDYLRKWPYLNRIEQIDLYCAEAKRLFADVASGRRTVTKDAMGRSASDFHKTLKSRLGQS